MKQEPTQKELSVLLQKYFPKREINSIKRITEGYSHYMYECKTTQGTYIIRISYNKNPRFGIAKEIWVLNQYRTAGVPVPEVIAWNEGEKYDFMIMKKLEGTPADALWNTLKRQEQEAIAKEIGKILGKMHSITFPHFGHIEKNGVSNNDFSFRKQSDIATERNEWAHILYRDGLEDLSLVIAQELTTPEQSGAIVQFLHNRAHVLKKSTPVLTHGDFQLSHIFLQKKKNMWTIVGLIDFEFAESYAREFDFVKLHRAGILDNENIKKAILEGYGMKHITKEFDTRVLLCRIVQDIGFAGHVAKAGNKTEAHKAIHNVLKTIQNETKGATP